MKQLGQLAPVNDTAASLYSPPSGAESVIREFLVCNTTSSEVTYSIFNDDDGTTYTNVTALYFNIKIPGNHTHEYTEKSIVLNNSNGNFAVKTETANALTFTAWGQEITP